METYISNGKLYKARHVAFEIEDIGENFILFYYKFYDLDKNYIRKIYFYEYGILKTLDGEYTEQYTEEWRLT